VLGIRVGEICHIAFFTVEAFHEAKSIIGIRIDIDRRSHQYYKESDYKFVYELGLKYLEFVPLPQRIGES
jgi:hypothetical protein